MELAHIEPGPERLLRLAPQPPDRELADLVRERLAGNGDVAIDLGGSVGRAHRAVVEHVFDRLLTRPMLGMEAGVGDQPHSAQDLVVEMAVILIGIGEEAKLIAKALRIERPALGKSGVAAETLEGRETRILLGKADLEMMARASLVEEQGLKAPGVAR